MGPAPVPLEDYWDWVEAQSINQVKVEKEQLRGVFADYVVPDHFLNKLGPAINSGRSIFLFGPSGNGKTLMANCIGHAFQDTVYIPYSLFVYGQIIRLYDEVNHQPVSETPDTPLHDKRWVLCRRPIVIAGGKKIPEKDALIMAQNAVREGATGVDMGRNIFQSEDPRAMIQAVRAVVHDNMSAGKALEMYEDLKKSKK